MDDTAKPYDQTTDATETGAIPSEDAPDTLGSSPDIPEPAATSDPAIALGSEASLTEDPFAGLDPFAAPKAAPVADPHPSLFDADEIGQTRETPEPPVSVEEEPLAEPAVEEPADDVPVEDLSLDDMVGELATDEELPIASEPQVTETGPEIETAEGDESPEGAEGAGSGEEAVEEDRDRSWRDEVAEAAAVPEFARQRLSARLPFWIYGGVWVVFVGVMTYLMWPLSAAPFVGETYYAYYILGGAGLLGVGPVVALAVWLSARMGATPVERGGLVRAVCLRAAGWMTVGVATMWVSLFVLDLHRIGRL